MFGSPKASSLHVGSLPRCVDLTLTQPGTAYTQLFYTMYCIFRDIFSPVRVANRGLCAVGHSQATRIVDLFGSFFGRKYFENLWQVTT
jgi:hypothetical protein